MCGLYYPHPNNTIFISKGRKDDEEGKKRNGSQFRARMSENQTKKGRWSSWLTEAASYGAEPVEPVPNRLVKNPKFGQKVPK